MQHKKPDGLHYKGNETVTARKKSTPPRRKGNGAAITRKKPIPSRPMPAMADLQPAVQDLYDEYAKVINDGPLKSWPDLFTESCLYRVVSCENWERGLTSSAMSREGLDLLKKWIADIRKTQARTPRYLRSVVSSITICNIDNDTVRTCVNWAIRPSMLFGLGQALLEGKYLDTLVRVDGQWKFQEKICVFDSDIIPNSIVYPI